jgi:hypothetical protein
MSRVPFLVISAIPRIPYFFVAVEAPNFATQTILLHHYMSSKLLCGYNITDVMTINNKLAAIWGGVLLGGLAIVYLGSEGLVQFYRHGMGSRSSLSDSSPRKSSKSQAQSSYSQAAAASSAAAATVANNSSTS